MIGVYTGRRGELNFESDFVELLIKNGWETNVIRNATEEKLEENLREIIDENNVDKLGLQTPLTDGEFYQIIDKIKVDCTSPVKSNIFINGKNTTIISEVDRDKYKVGDEIYLFLFDPVQVAGGKSRYQIAEQIVFETGNKYNDRRGDLMLLINGLPLIHIELKASGHSLEEGTYQIQKYMNEGVFKGLFNLIQVFFVATPEDVIYFANSYPTLNPTFFFHWGDKYNKAINDWKKLIQGSNQILSIPEAHQLVGYYTAAAVEKNSNGCIENTNTGNLMVARSYQVNAIRAIMRKVKSHQWKVHDLLGGYVWGTTGCGKTFSSYKAGQLLIDKNYADKVVFVVDRKALDDQSYKEYMALTRDGEPIKNTPSTHKLFRALANDSNKIIITSIQKLSRINEAKSKYISQKDIEKINNKRIVFIIDEAHRSQFGDMHEQIKKTFTNGLFIGFTGTPIFVENDKNSLTSETVFGECLSIYSIASGIRDKNVLGFDPIKISTFTDRDLKNAVACEAAKINSYDEIGDDEKRRKIYNDYYNLDMIEIEKRLPPAQYDCDEHRKEVVKNVLDNWNRLSNKGGRIEFHAIFATSSIAEAIKYYHLFKDTDLKVTALFDTSLNEDSKAAIDKEKALIEIVDDYNNMFAMGKIINREADPSLQSFKADVIARLSHKPPYKNISKEDTLDMVIVVDQLLTGFDSKYVNTLYLDKVLEMDGLIQAISRTNRVLDFNEKPWGIFKYYRKPYTMERNIKEALKLYCQGEENKGIVVSKIEENLKSANALYDEIKHIFEIENIQNFVKVPEEKENKQKFKKLFVMLSRTLQGMKLQGMDWNNDDDKNVLQLNVCKKWIDNQTRIYDVLAMRYKDLLPPRDPSYDKNVGYLLTTNLSEVEQEKIDADYLEKHFRLIIPILLKDEIDEKESRQIQEFEQQVIILPKDDQFYAESIVNGIKNEKDIDYKGKTLKELISEYKEKNINDSITEFAEKYGLNRELLQKIYYEPGNHDIEIGTLRDTCDKNKVMVEFGGNILTAKAALVSRIKEFVNH